MASKFIIEGLKELRDLADGYKGAPALVSRLIKRACGDYIQRARTTAINEHLTKRGPETLGVYRGSLSTRLAGEVTESGKDIFASLGSPMPYARAWEYGRPPGQQPPSAPLAEWAKKILGVSDKEAKSVGFLIARSIGRKGRTARPFLRPALEKNIGYLTDDITTLIQGAAQGGWKYGV